MLSSRKTDYRRWRLILNDLEALTAIGFTDQLFKLFPT